MPRKFIIFSTKKLSISKYLVYFILMYFLLLPLSKRVWYAITYTKTMGIIDAFFEDEYYTSRGRRVNYYPEVYYAVGADTFVCYGSRFQHEAVRPLDSIPVIYNPAKKQDAYVYTPLGFWMPPLTYIIPFSLFITLAIFGLDSIPKYFTIKF